MILVREEKPEDIEKIRDINLKAFGQPREAGIVDKLRKKSTPFISLVAESENKLTGHILFTPASVGAAIGMGLAPMAVLPEFQNQGIGSTLVNEGMKKIEEMGFPFVVVLGHPEFYPRFGFAPASEYGINCEWEVPDEAFMILVLDPAKMKGISGLVTYRPEFAEAM